MNCGTGDLSNISLFYICHIILRLKHAGLHMLLCLVQILDFLSLATPCFDMKTRESTCLVPYVG